MPIVILSQSPLGVECVGKADLTVRALDLIHGVSTQLLAVDGIGAEVRGDGVAHHVQLYAPLEEQRAQTVVVVLQRAADHRH